MKVNVTIGAVKSVERMLAVRYDVPKLQNALDSAYNDGTAIVETESGISSARATEKKNLFNSRDGIVQKREGKLTDPLRMIAWLKGFEAFCKRCGEPAGELNEEILPQNLVFWLETKFLKDGVETKLESKPGKGGTRRNGNIEAVKTPEVPAAK